jgi:hypothetical protein
VDAVGWSLLLAGLFVWVAPVVIGIVMASLAVAAIGPRERDSLILPGLAASAAATVALFETESFVAIPVVAAAVAFGLAAAQRWALVRVDRSPRWWPRIARGAAILARLLLGGFFGYVAALGRRPELIVIGGIVGACLLGILALRSPADRAS